MERLEYGDYEGFVCDIVDTFDSLEDKFDDVSIIAKYEEAKEIVRELLCLGYDMVSIDIRREEFEKYYDEYRIALNQDGIWCEKFKRANGYFDDDATITYVMDNCSSAVFKHIDSEEIYEVCVGEDDLDEGLDNDVEDETEHSYMVNGKSVDKETFNEYVSQFTPNLVDNKANELKNGDYTISVKCNLDVDEALEIITDMERRMTCMNDIFHEMDCFRRLFNW